MITLFGRVTAMPHYTYTPEGDRVCELQLTVDDGRVLQIQVPPAALGYRLGQTVAVKGYYLSSVEFVATDVLGHTQYRVARQLALGRPHPSRELPRALVRGCRS